MSRKLFFTLLATIICLNTFSQKNESRQWPSYRGYLLSGVLDNANIPSSFNLKSGQNVLWKAPIEGLGLSSPVIWDNNLYITTAVSDGDKKGYTPGIYGNVAPVPDSSVHEWKVICLDKNSGKVKWEQTAFKGVPKIKRHPKSTHANTSVATDGKYVVAFFGSEGLYCYDTKGNLQWKQNFGVLRSVFFMMPGAEWEYASSPIIYKGILVIQVDVLENSFIAAFDVASGKQLWKTVRDDYPTWSTPNIYTSGGIDFIVVNGFKHMGGYDLKTGKEVWRMSGGGDIPIPSPIVGDSLIYLNGAHGPFSPILAISKDAKGDISLPKDITYNEYVKWSRPRGGSYMHTMLLYHDKLYNVGWNGAVNCINSHTGKEIYNAKLGKAKSFIASPVATDGKIFIVDEEGTVYIISDGDVFTQIAEIPLGEICMTAPAITDGIIYFRTQHQLIAVGKK